MALPDAYITVTEATDEYAVRVADAAAWAAASAAQQAAALLQASDEIDTLRFAGEPYDADQDRAFPRIVYDPPSQWPEGKATRSYTVWDLDDDDEAIVPLAVEFAVFLQALSLLAEPSRRERLRDRHQGITVQSAAGFFETYQQGKAVSPVCFEALQQLRPYLLKSGRMT